VPLRDLRNDNAITGITNAANTETAKETL